MGGGGVAVVVGSSGGARDHNLGSAAVSVASACLCSSSPVHGRVCCAVFLFASQAVGISALTHLSFLPRAYTGGMGVSCASFASATSHLSSALLTAFFLAPLAPLFPLFVLLALARVPSVCGGRQGAGMVHHQPLQRSANNTQRLWYQRSAGQQRGEERRGEGVESGEWTME